MTAAEIAVALGGAHRSGAWWRGRCPVHDSRGATLALRDGERGLIAVCHAGCSRAEILAELGRSGLLVGPADNARTVLLATQPRREDDARRIGAARRIWDRCQDARGSPVVAYLDRRRIHNPPPHTLRYAPALRHPSGIYLPAMVAAIVDVAGELIGVHRTYLQPEGTGKADVEPAKVMLGRAGGGAVRLAPAGNLLMVCEGVETGLSAQQACGLPCWAAGSTSGLLTLVLPAIVRQVIILADHDANGAGERAAHAAAARWVAERRQVRIAMPPEPDTDFNDVLLGPGHSRIAEVCNAAA